MGKGETLCPLNTAAGGTLGLLGPGEGLCCYGWDGGCGVDMLTSANLEKHRCWRPGVTFPSLNLSRGAACSHLLPLESSRTTQAFHHHPQHLLGACTPQPRTPTQVPPTQVCLLSSSPIKAKVTTQSPLETLKDFASPPAVAAAPQRQPSAGLVNVQCH